MRWTYTPELVAAIFAVGDAVDTAFLLELHNLLDRLLLDRYELLGRGGLVSNSIALLDELLRAEERANVLCGKT